MTHAYDSNNWLNCEELVDREAKTPAVSTQHATRMNITGVAAKRMPGAFYVTAVRDPTARCLSQFYFEVSRLGQEPTTARKIAFMRRLCGGDYQHIFTMPAPGSTARAIVASYDFVAVTERFDESLVILAKKLGVGFADILYLSGRKSGWSVNTTTGRRLLEHPPLDEEPEAVQEAARATFGESFDAQILEAANLALDRAISDYGPRFSGDFAEFKRMLAVTTAKCVPRHDEGGCFTSEIGCGQPCIDAALTDCTNG